MAESKTTPNPSFDYKPLIVPNPDGTYTRLRPVPTVPASQDPRSSTSPVLTKDSPINPTRQTWFRLYLPRHLLSSSLAAGDKLPLIVYYHGGGFVFLSAASCIIHDFCLSMAEKVNAVVVSVDYRLAPEHRLPAAYDDAVEALHVIKNIQDDWLNKFADLSNCFMMGTSAGGNIAYHAGLRACEQVEDLYPLKTKGMILHHPFFGGSERTGSELSLAKDPVLPLAGSDLLWELSLPAGADRDHVYSNPESGNISNTIELTKKSGLRVLLTGCYGDPLIDRQVKFADVLKENGVAIVTRFGEGCHSVELFDPSKAESFFLILKDFLNSNL